jgi:hypothetical protein
MNIELTKQQLELIKDAIRYNLAEHEKGVTDYRELWSYLLKEGDKIK